MNKTRRIRYIIFLRDVGVLALTAFGGPQAHLAMFIDLLVQKRRYLSEEDLMELFALCQILPGPTSTQTLTAIGFRMGGPPLAFLTLTVWALPAVSILTGVAMTISVLGERDAPMVMVRYLPAVALGFVAYAALRIIVKVVKTKTGIGLMIFVAIITFIYPSPFLLPVLLLVSGAFVARMKYRQQPKEEKTPLKIVWSNFFLFAAVWASISGLAATIKVLPLKLMDNFYRTGALIFGGGQVLIPLLYSEFVDYKKYLTASEFLSGYGIAQAVPGPVFSFCAYIGTLSMRAYGPGGEIVGGVLAAVAIFLPGTFLIFFVIRFWDSLKKYRVVRASLEGIHAASAGMITAAVLLMAQPLELNWTNSLLTLSTAIVLALTKIPGPVLILATLLAGYLIPV